MIRYYAKTAFMLLALLLLLNACSSSDNDESDSENASSSSSSSSTSSSGTSSSSSSTSSSSSGLPIPPPETTIPIGGLGGTVDSSLIARGDAESIVNHSAGINAVYLFSGNVTPNDVGSSTPPFSIAAVNQANGACSWHYVFNSVPPGNYTVAFTHEADEDNAGSDDNLNFIGTTQITVSASTANERNFAPTMAVVRVGPGRTYISISDAADNIGDNTIVEIDAGTYVDDISNWDQDNIVLRGVGGYAHLRADNIIPNNINGRGIWVTGGNNITVEYIEFSGATVPDENGAGIRAEGNDLRICSCYFHDNENGILGGAYGEMLIEYSEFNHNGLGEFGRTHNVYIDDGSTLVFRYNYSHHTTIGHNLKSRAEENYIFYNRLMDEADGNSSYAAEFPQGGLVYLVGNLLQQGPNTDNSSIVSFAAENANNSIQEFFAINNSVVNDDSGGQFFAIERSPDTVKIVNNILADGGSIPSGPDVHHNLVVSDPSFVDIANYNYQLTSASSGAIDAGIDPGNDGSFSLTPAYEYVHPRQYRVRTVVNSLDIGAYEYTP